MAALFKSVSAGKLCRLWILELGQQANFANAELVIVVAHNDGGVPRLVVFACARP